MEGATTSIRVLKALAGNAPAELNVFQEFLASHTETLVAAWFSLWVLTIVVLLLRVWREYAHHGSSKEH